MWSSMPQINFCDLIRGWDELHRCGWDALHGCGWDALHGCGCPDRPNIICNVWNITVTFG